MKVLMWLSIGMDRRTPSEHLLDAIVDELYKAGHTVHILQKKTNGDRPLLTSVMRRLGVTTTSIPHKNVAKGNFAVRYLEDVRYVLKCRKLLKSELDYDCVFLQSSNVAGIQVRLLRRISPQIQITFNVQDIFPENAAYSHVLKPNGMMYSFFSALQRPAYQESNHVITISEDMRDELIRIGCQEDKIHVVYNWSYQDAVYDLQQTQTKVVSQLLPHDRFNVVYAGNIGKMQNVEIVLRAAERLKNQSDILFSIIGNGLYRKKLETYANERQLTNVVFHDMLASEDAPSIYCRADINIIPLAENIFRTALPSKTATCLACQRPVILVIGSNSRFARKVMEATGCPVIDSDDVEALSNAICLIKEGKVNIETADFFCEHMLKKSNSDLYAKIIAGEK